jgi:hypothetical protein
MVMAQHFSIAEYSGPEMAGGPRDVRSLGEIITGLSDAQHSGDQVSGPDSVQHARVVLAMLRRDEDPSFPPQNSEETQ